jgi:hypothetical protein
MAKKQRMGGGFDPFAKKVEEFRRDYGQFSIAKIHSVHENLGVVVGLLDEHTTGAIPIEWFNRVNETWRPNGLACPYVYDSNRRQWAIDKYNELKEQIEKENSDEARDNETSD